MDKPIYLDSELHEIGYAEAEIDFEIGSTLSGGTATNDFEFETGNAPDNVGAVYIDGTEYGGIIEYKKQNTENETITYKGYTWRGLLNQWLICPPDGEDYYTVSGDLNDVLSELLSDVLGGFFTVPSSSFGVSVSSYKFDRYCTLLEGLEKLFSEYDARLYIHADKTGPGEPIVVTVEAAEIDTVSGSFDPDDASELILYYTDDNMGINHLICMGSGELSERMRVDLYIDGDGNVSQEQYYTGFEERQELYDFSSAESEDDLISYGTDRLKSVASEKSMSIDVADESLELEIGDRATGIFPDGTQVTSPITKKTLTITASKTTISYSVEGS